MALRAAAVHKGKLSSCLELHFLQWNLVKWGEEPSFNLLTRFYYTDKSTTQSKGTFLTNQTFIWKLFFPAKSLCSSLLLHCVLQPECGTDIEKLATHLRPFRSKAEYRLVKHTHVQLQHSGYYWGSMTMEEAHKLLTPQPLGTFLVR